LTICAKCKADESTADVWGQELCPECFHLWGVEAPTSGEVEAKLSPHHFHASQVGNEGTLRQPLPGILEECYRRFTKGWVTK
jgi:hypothetical protein